MLFFAGHDEHAAARVVDDGQGEGYAVGFALGLQALLSRRRPGQSAAELVVLALGNKIGKAVCLLLALWLLVYAGFTLRAGTERLISCVYADGKSWLLSLTMAALACVAASGRLHALAGTGRVLGMILLVVLVLTCAASVPGVRPEFLWPPRQEDIPGLLLTAGLVFIIPANGVFFLLLLAPVREAGLPVRPTLRASLIMCLLLGVVMAVTVGTLSASVTAGLQYPFFSLIRNVSVGTLLERFEALVLAVWVCADFLFLASLLYMIRILLRTVLGRDSRAAVIVSAAVMTVLSQIVWSGTLTMKTASGVVFPLGNTALTVAVVPGIFLLGRLRKKF